MAVTQKSLKGLFPPAAGKTDLSEAERKLTAYCKKLLADVGRVYHVVTPGTPFKEAEKFGVSRERLKKLRSANTAVVRPSDKALLFPSTKDLLQRVTDKFGLNSASLHGVGLTDGILQASNIIHETSHVMGHEGSRWTEENFVWNEAHVYALTTARFTAVSGLPANHDIAKFIDDTHLMHNLFYLLRGLVEESTYVWSPSAVSLARSRLPDAWDAARDQFRKHFTVALDHFCWRVRPPPFARARQAMDPGLLAIAEMDNVSSTLRLRDVALEAEKNLKRAGHTSLIKGRSDDTDWEAFSAALILRQFARAIDGVVRYADGYYPPVMPIGGTPPVLAGP